MTAMDPAADIDEQSPLLPSQREKKERVTPLPMVQMGTLMLLQLAEPITSQCIYPFINQLISELNVTGGDERKVGYYAGMIQSLFFATEALFVLQWSMLSDRIGRKPVLLTGMAGLCISMICFGLSRTFMGLVISRCLVGMLNGNTGVMKSMVTELTDSTNMAQAFALIPIVWSAGATVGPFMGGTLARPHDRWPELFSHSFWREYPYFLPCAASALFSLVVFIIVAICLKETVPDCSKKLESEPESLVKLMPECSEAPSGLRDVMIKPVIISVANYGLLALFDIAWAAIQPLFYATPIEYGGLGMSPATIGAVLGALGFSNGIFQGLFFAKLVKTCGMKRLFMTAMTAFTVIFSLFPVINYVARYEDGVTPLVWALIASQMFVVLIMNTAYGCIFLYIASAAPNRRCLGATNGLAQVVASILRAIGPATSTSLFALSHEYNWLGGNAVFLILAAASACSLFACDLLPQQQWPKEERDN
ncbi:hypothetical protein EUX98_g3224 [Antrodiella citrinella]|uniref:Major facilitator superfamily (MFS) profile domain-containing protein n=1 Tax=Antrodiella citrinella TaxID=2447956 RepID=A0A4S4MX41_9APHY|nr:hypothetical protein EUX98_g3224 [Antrodiella citrinella]